MAVDNTTLARPYAKAVFELANEAGKLADWSDFLAGLAKNLDQDAVMTMLNDPKLTPVQTGEVLLAALEGQLQPQQSNFIRLLAENDRLAVVTEISELFEDERARAEKISEVTVVSAFPVTDEQKATIKNKLTAHLGSDVRIDTEVDEALVGGAIIKIGDQVIDGSVRGRLAKLTAAML